MTRFEELPAKVQEELLAFYDEQEQDKVRHRDFAIEFCGCHGCEAIRVREYQEEQHRLYRKIRRGLRKETV